MGPKSVDDQVKGGDTTPVACGSRLRRLRVASLSSPRQSSQDAISGLPSQATISGCSSE